VKICEKVGNKIKVHVILFSTEIDFNY